MNILLTGGCGYIGSHTAIELVEQGYSPVLYDNLSNSSADVVDTLREITGRQIPLEVGDVLDGVRLREVLNHYEIDVVIHFAGLKSVEESQRKVLEYYACNVQGSISLLGAMQQVGVKKILFSSSASVYGKPRYLPVDEEHPVEAITPYGHNKLQVEQLLSDLAVMDTEWEVTALRYFNPAGLHPSGMLSDTSGATGLSLVPVIKRVIRHELPHLEVYGGDYGTPDGSGVRDYIHVMDLAKGHVAALQALSSGFSIYNLGTGTGYSVLEMLHAFELALGDEIPYQVVERRAGDVAVCYADVSKAEKVLGWKAQLGLDEMCRM